MNASDIQPIESINKQVKAVRFRLPKEKALNGIAVKLREICLKHRGDKEVIIEVYEKGKFTAEIAAHSDFYVKLDDDFKQDISKILEPHEYMFEWYIKILQYWVISEKIKNYEKLKAQIKILEDTVLKLQDLYKMKIY